MAYTGGTSRQRAETWWRSLLEGGAAARASPDRFDPSPADYAALFEHAPTGYMLFDASGCIQHINRTGADLLGWDPSWLSGKQFIRWVATQDRPAFAAHWQTLRHGRAAVSDALRVKNRQGCLVSLRLHSRPADAAGVSRSILIDVSEEQDSARALRQLQTQVLHLARLQTAGEMAAALAHEINQPLGTVVLNCDAALRLLNEGHREDYEFAAALTEATEAAAYAGEVIRHLRAFLRKGGEHRQACFLAELIRAVTPLIQSDARDQGIALQLDIDPDLPEVYADRIQIEQVLINLAHNGIEAMDANEAAGANRVTIRARREPPDHVRIQVEDTGPGLNDGQAERMFEPFYTTKPEGMGMGLAISRTIVEAHGGRLWADSALGHGTTMQFTLPVMQGVCPC